MCPAYPADPERPKPPIRLRYEHPTRRPRPIRPPLDPGVQSSKVRFEIQPVIRPRNPVDPRGGVRTDRPIRLPQTIDRHVMKKRGEPHLLVPTRHPAHTIQITGHAQPGTGSGTCFAGRVPLAWPPSLHHLRPRSPGIVRRFLRYYAAIRLPALVHRGITASAFPSRPATTPICHPANHPGRGIIDGHGRPQGLPVLEHGDLRACPGSSTARGPPTTRDSAAGGVAFRLSEERRHPKPEISRLNSPACTTPVNASPPPSRAADARLGAIVCR